jgi:hypothetical protein
MKCCTCSLPVSPGATIFSFSKICLVSVLLILPGLSRLAGAVAPPAASPCTLAWNLNQDVSVTGYALYYGITGSTTNRQVLGITNTVTLFNLLASSNYFFYMTAFDATGVESLPSNVLYYKPQALSSLKLTSIVAGKLTFQFRAAPLTLCWLQYSPSLSSPQWQTLSIVTADLNGNITITDQPPANTPSRFYRTVIPLP